MKSLLFFALLATAPAVAAPRDGVVVIGNPGAHGPTLSGVWALNDTHTFYLQENRDGSVTGTVLIRDNTQYEATVSVQPAGPGVYVGTGSQWFTFGGCVETYFASYTLTGPNRARVDINGSTGACGVSPNYRLTYEIQRQNVPPRPLQGRWVLGSTHTFQFDETPFGGVAGTVSVPSLPGFSAQIEAQARMPFLYDGIGQQTYNGCTESFNARYALLNRSRVRVTITGSDGACGTPLDFHYAYDIVRG